MKKVIKDFMSIQKTFFSEVLMDYVRIIPSVIKSLFLFFTILVELPVQMFKSFFVSEEAYVLGEKVKEQEILHELVSKGVSEDKILAELEEEEK